MGLIRKTFSVGTFGVVSFRSKNERLQRAERSQHHAEASLDEEHTARVAAEDSFSGSEKRAKRASAQAAHAAKRLERSKHRNRRHHRSETTRDVLAAVEPIVHSGIDNVRGASTHAAERSRRAGRRTRKAATRSLRRAKESAAPRAASVAARAADVLEHLTAPDE
jgi:hypothetical protein